MSALTVHMDDGLLTLEHTKITLVTKGEVVLHISDIFEASEKKQARLLKRKPGLRLSKGTEEVIKAYFPKEEYKHMYYLLYEPKQKGGHDGKAKKNHSVEQAAKP